MIEPVQGNFKNSFVSKIGYELVLVGSTTSEFKNHAWLAVDDLDFTKLVSSFTTNFHGRFQSWSISTFILFRLIYIFAPPIQGRPPSI